MNYAFDIVNVILTKSEFERKANVSSLKQDTQNEARLTNKVLDSTNPDFLNISLRFEIFQPSESDFLVKADIEMVGVFAKREVEDESDLSIELFINRVGPEIIYPYVREHLSSLTLKAGLVPLMAPIINFKGKDENITFD